MDRPVLRRIALSCIRLSRLASWERVHSAQKSTTQPSPPAIPRPGISAYQRISLVMVREDSLDEECRGHAETYRRHWVPRRAHAFLLFPFWLPAEVQGALPGPVWPKNWSRSESRNSLLCAR